MAVTLSKAPRVAVLGAGLSGSFCAGNVLRSTAHLGVRPHVVVYDRQPQLGGRLATRQLRDQYVELGAHSFRGDTTVDPAWEAALRFLEAEGLMEATRRTSGLLRKTGEPKFGRTERCFQPTRGNAQICEHLLEGAELRLGCEVVRMHPVGGSSWLVEDAEGLRELFDWVVVTSPTMAAEG
eukprot:Hpha_TRINITY_DN25446_c0_g1::TRINITY_DN25446_c0_g1_i1::g.167708::m.167708